MQTLSTLLLTLLASGLQEAGGDSPTIAELQAHYARVEVELLAADTTHLTPDQRAARARSIEALRAYRERGDFGRATQPRGRQFLFVDDGGRRCAVAEILHVWGRDDVVERIARTHNDALVAELAGDAELAAWLDPIGLTIEEAARIQGPGGGAGGGPTFDRRVRRRQPPTQSWGGPGDTVGRGDAGAGGAGQSAPGGEATSNPVTPGASAPLSPGTPGSGIVARTSHAVGPESWWTWWELHKLDYLRPNMIRNWVATVTGYSRGDGYPAKQLELVRKELLPIALRDLRDGDPDVRAGAALAVGRMGGDDAVAPLLAALEDASMFVRERALLSLGATGSDRAGTALLEIARTGALEERRERVCPDARLLAIIGLAVGRRNGMDEGFDAEVASLTASLTRSQRTAVQTALACYQTLVPNAALEGWVFERAGDEKTADPARSRALEALRFQEGDDALHRLLRAVSAPRLEARRSAGLALGEIDHDLAIQPLLTASELEKEPLARAFLLISIGRQGGDEAKSFLLDRLRTGPKTHRAWCALALGILARESDDEEVREVLRARLRHERNREARGAWYLALGMARDEDAVGILHAAVVDGDTPETRSAAAFGLAMVGTEEARTVLLERLTEDSCPFTRAQIAQAIGFLGDARDADALVETLRDQSGPDYLSTVALALGLHGSRAALEGLVEVVKDERASPAARAAALEAVQLLVGTGPSLTLADLLRQTNYAVFPPPLVRHLDMPL